MSDALFADPRLAVLYDTFEGDRLDLLAYLRLARELGARTVLDVGCGTGSFALIASATGLAVTGVDPAEASIEVARAKPGAESVTWHCGTAATSPRARVDLAVMTGNVAQVFLSDEAWLATLRAVRDRLAADGHLVYETRRVEDRAWQRWSCTPYEASATVEGVGLVHVVRRVIEVDLPLVSFRFGYTFPDGEQVTSDSTLRFRGDDENRDLLTAAGYSVTDVREAPDRPGRERVYLASPRTGHLASPEAG
ncbi:MAG: class I SAM-dependent methyltransferase [Nocardioides sp.]